MIRSKSLIINKTNMKLKRYKNKLTLDIHLLISELMKKTGIFLAILLGLITVNGCTNDENDEKIDILTPNDDTETSQNIVKKDTLL